MSGGHDAFLPVLPKSHCWARSDFSVLSDPQALPDKLFPKGFFMKLVQVARHVSQTYYHCDSWTFKGFAAKQLMRQYEIV